MRSILPLAGLALLILGSLPAFAQIERPDPAELFAQADTNHDGVVSRQEFLAARAARFHKLDRNHDGYLTDADIPRFMRNNAGAMQKFHALLQMADTNHDGKVSREEFMAVGNRMFDLIDTNHDNVIDQAEMQQAAERLKAFAAGQSAP